MPTQDIVEQQSPKLREFYDRFKEPMKLPDFELFQRTLQDPTKRKEFYDSFQKPAKLPDYETFQNTLGLNKPFNEQTEQETEVKAPTDNKPAVDPLAEKPEKAPLKGKNGQDLTALYDVMAKQETIKDSGMYGETSKLPVSAAQMEKKVKGEEYARSVITDADFQKSTVTEEEKDMVDLKSYFDLQKERYSNIASDLETWTNSAVQGAEVNAADKTQKDSKYIAIVTDIQNKALEYQQQLAQQFKEQIGERAITTNEANQFNAQINQKVQAFQDDLFEKNPELKNIHQSYMDKEVTRINQEYLHQQKEMMRPNTKILPQSVMDLGNKLVSSDAFQSLGYEEKKYTLANNWKRISRSLSSKGFNQARILMMRDEFYFAMMPKVLYDEEQHMTPFALRSWAEENMDSVDKQLKEVQAKLKENQSQTDLIGSYRPANAEYDPNMGLPPVDKADDNLRKDFQNLLLAKQNLEAIRNMPEENMGTFGQGFLDSGIRNKVPFISSMMDIMDLNRLLNTANKVKNKEQLTDADQALLNSYSAKENMEQLSKPSMWYNAGKATAASVPYMAEFVATSGIFDGTYLAAKAGLTKALGKAAEKTLYQRAFIKPLAGILAVEAQTAANPQAYIKNTMERMRPSMQVAFSEEANDLVAKLDWNAKNELTGYNTGRGEDKWTAFVKGYLLTSGEMATERAGEVLTGTFKWALAKPGVQKFMSPDLMKRMTLGYYMEKYGYNISEARKRIMSHGLSWNGFPAEMVEEVLNIPFSNIVTGDQSVFTGIVKEDGTGIDWNNLGTIAISIGATSGVMTATQFAMARKAKPVTVHYTDANGTTAPVKINGEAFNKLVESTRNLNAEELTKWKDETLPKMNLKGEEKDWVNDYVDVIIKKKQAEASPNSDPTMNTDDDQMLAEVEEIIQEEAEIIATENPELVSSDTAQTSVNNPKTKSDEKDSGSDEKEASSQNSKEETLEPRGEEKEEVLETSTEDSVKKIEEINDQISEVEGNILNRKKELLDKKIAFGDDKDLSDLESKLKQLRDDKSAVVDQKKSPVSESVEKSQSAFPSLERNEFISAIADGTAQELIQSGQDDILSFMEKLDQEELPLPKFFKDLEENTADEQGYYTEEEDARLLELINRATERTGIPLVQDVDQLPAKKEPGTTKVVVADQQNKGEWDGTKYNRSIDNDTIKPETTVIVSRAEYGEGKEILILAAESNDKVKKGEKPVTYYRVHTDIDGLTPSANWGVASNANQEFNQLQKEYENREPNPEPPEEKIKKIVKKSGAPAKNVIVSPSPSKQKAEVKPGTEKRKAQRKVQSQELDDALDDLFATSKKSRGKLTSGGIDLETLAKATKVVGMYLRNGVYKFSDMVQDIAAKSYDGAKEVFEAMKNAYGAYIASSEGTDEQKDQMDDPRKLGKLKFEDLVPEENDQEGEEPQVNESDKFSFTSMVKNPISGTQNEGSGQSESRKEGGILPTNEQKRNIDKLIGAIDSLKVGKPGQVFSFDPITALGVSVWNTALDVFKTSLIAGKMLYDAINDAVISLRPHLPSAAVSEDEVRDYLETAIKNPDTLLSVQDQRQLKSTVKAGLAGKSNAIHNTLYNSPIFAGPTIKGGVLGSTVRFQQKTFGTASQGAGDLISKAALKGLQSKIPGLSQLTRALSHIFQNLERDSKHVRRAEQFYGTTESRAMLDAASLSNHLKDVLKVQGVDALRRIDEVLDPEFYSKYSYDDFFKLWDSYFAGTTGSSVSSSLSEKEKKDLYEEYIELEKGIAGFNRTPLSYDDLTDEEKYVHDMIKQVYEYIHDVNFAIGKLGVYTYLKNRNKYHARMYNAYEQPASIEAALAEASKYMQLGMYEKRETLDMWKMREKIDDPIHAVSKRLMQTIANKGIADYASWLLANRPGLVSKTEKTGFVKLESRGYGDLSGKYVLKDVAEDFQGFHFSSGIMQKFYDVIRLLPILGTDWKSGNKYLPFLSQQFWKKYFTIYNPAVHMGNFMGNIIFALSMGVNPVRFNANFFTGAKAEIKRKGQLYQWMVNEGMMNADVSWEDMTNNVSKMDLLVNKSGMPTWDDLKSKPFNSLSRLAERIYHINDNIGKVAAMQSLLQMGLSWDQASEKVKNGMQNRNRIGPLYKVMSKIPIIGPPFGMFTGDLIRIITSGFTRTPLTMGVYIAGLHGLAALASGFGDEDEDERQRKIREGRPGFTSIPLPELVENDWAKYVPIINFFAGPVPLSIKWGKNGELNLARFLSPLYIYQSPTDDDFYNAIQRLSPLPIEKEMDWTSNPQGIKAVWLAKMAKDPRFSPLIQMWSDSDFRGIPISDRKATVYRSSTITDAEKAANVRQFLARSYIPYYYLVDDIKSIEETGKDYYDRKRTSTQVTLRFLVGYNAQVFDDAKYVDVATKAVMAKASQFARNEKIIKDLDNQYLESLKTDEPMDVEVFKKRKISLLDKQAVIFEEVKEQLIKARGTLAASEMKAALKKVRMSKQARIKLLNSPSE